MNHIVDAHVAYIKTISDLNQDKAELLKRIKRLEEALDCVVVSCACLHHPKKYRHKLDEACPVEVLIRKAKEDKP